MNYDAWKIAGIVLPTLMGLFILNIVVVHSGTPYEIDQINVHLTHALKTNNIQEKISFMEETLVLLEPYSGNSGFLFPTEVTDIDITKRILISVIDEVKTELNTQQEQRWAFLPHNELNSYINDQINSVYYRLSDFKRADSVNPESNPLLYILVFLMIVSFIMILVLDCHFNYRGYED